MVTPGITIIWAVDFGAYEQNGICWLFPTEILANEFAAKMNAREAARGGYPSHDPPYHVHIERMAESCEIAMAEDDRMTELHETDPAAWWKEIGC
jgi:hypothetical protein